MYRKSMRKALQEARAYRDPLQEDKGFSSQQIKMAYGILNDPRYKQGNYSGAVKAIEKIAKGLSNHPDVANALKRANEETITEFKKMVVTIKDPVKRNQAMQDIQRFGKGTGFRIDKMSDGKSFRIDGKGADLNKFATDMKNFYGAEIKAESLEEAKTVGGALAQGHLETMTDQRFKEFYGMTKDEYIKKHGDPRKEELDEALEVKWDANKQGWFDKQGKRRYLGKFATSKLMSKANDKAKASGDFITPFELKHGQKPEQVEEKTELNEAININIVKGMTQRNDHFGARLYIAEQMRDKEMMTIYQGLGLAHDNYNRYVGNSAVMVRQKLESALKVKIIGQYGRQKGAEIIKAL